MIDPTAHGKNSHIKNPRVEIFGSVAKNQTPMNKTANPSANDNSVMLRRFNI